MNNLHKLTNLNLIWIENQGFWVYQCKSCQQVKLEPLKRSCRRPKEPKC